MLTVSTQATPSHLSDLVIATTAYGRCRFAAQQPAAHQVNRLPPPRVPQWSRLQQRAQPFDRRAAGKRSSQQTNDTSGDSFHAHASLQGEAFDSAGAFAAHAAAAPTATRLGQPMLQDTGHILPDADALFAPWFGAGHNVAIRDAGSDRLPASSAVSGTASCVPAINSAQDRHNKMRYYSLCPSSCGRCLLKCIATGCLCAV